VCGDASLIACIRNAMLFPRMMFATLSVLRLIPVWNRAM
jgi:hypothetical protein